MSNFVEKSARNINDAITDALVELGLTRDEADIKIIEKGTKGFLGIGSKIATVRVSKKVDMLKVTEEFVKEFFEKFGADVVINVIEKKGNIEVNVSGDDLGYLIGKQGKYMEAMQYFINLALNKQTEDYVRIFLNVEHYKEKREEILKSLASKAAFKAVKYKKTIKLDSMNSYERRIVHASLQENDKVVTSSEGEEPNRRVVIALKK
ncbi:MAG: protein jag [Clostridia bacterium]|jgi:spoIIIJ-associated protein|nr:protein jag [Clostridia bacterium]